MIWAVNSTESSDRVRAVPKGRAFCPSCKTETIAKCGSIVTWHWAHKANECDPWHEGETEWHIDWKTRFPDNWQECVIGKHRADVRTPQGVIEFQAAPISPEEITAREQHYQRMVWILKGDDFEQNFHLRDPRDMWKYQFGSYWCSVHKQRYFGNQHCGCSSAYFNFRWKHPRKSWFAARSPILIDFGFRLFEIRKLHDGRYCAGWGIWRNTSTWVHKMGGGMDYPIALLPKLPKGLQ